MKKTNNKLQRLNALNQGGYTLIEMAVAFILSIILIYITASLYTQTMNIHRRQQRTMAIERALLDTHLALEQSLTSLPGRNLGIFSGEHFSIPLLPGAGSAFNPDSGKNEPLRLGIVTPYIVNGQPAFTLVYSSAAIPRLEISEPTTTLGDTGTARIIVPFVSTQFTPPTGDGSGKLITSNSTLSDSTLLSVKGGSTPSPSPSPSASPSPTPEPTKVPGSTGNTGNTGNTANPPQVAPGSTLTGLPFIPTPEMFQTGQLMLLAGSPASRRAGNTVLSKARPVKLNSVTQIQNSFNTTGSNPSYLQFTYDLCVNNCQGEISGLLNFADAPNMVSTGSLLIPIKVASFYIKRDQMSSRLVRNDNGLILPNGDGTFQISVGTETILGEADSMTVNYRLTDNSLQPSPSSPVIPWLNNITSLDIKLTKAMPSVQGTEDLTRSTDINFPVLVRNID